MDAQSTMFYYISLVFICETFSFSFTCLNSVRNTIKSSIGRTLAETIRISNVRRQRGACAEVVVEELHYFHLYVCFMMQ